MSLGRINIKFQLPLSIRGRLKDCRALEGIWFTLPAGEIGLAGLLGSVTGVIIFSNGGSIDSEPRPQMADMG